MIDILCPILGRSPTTMLRSLEHATMEPYTVTFICSENDDACPPPDDRYVTVTVPWFPGRADFAKKINYAFPLGSGEWVFQAADDIRFREGWDREALRVARTTGARVIGTNDLHNPSVLKELSATHLFFARSYIEERGGTVDDSGLVFSEAYDHQYVDNEFVETAKMRGEWAFAAASVVEHLHPVWQLAPWDPTYEKAFRETSQDHKLFVRRSRRLRYTRSR